MKNKNILNHFKKNDRINVFHHLLSLCWELENTLEVPRFIKVRYEPLYIDHFFVQAPHDFFKSIKFELKKSWGSLFLIPKYVIIIKYVT